MPVLFLLSLVGYILLLNQKLHIRTEYCPAVICASISSLMVIGGVIGALQITAMALMSIGLIALIYVLIGYKSIKFTKRDTVLMAAFFFVAVYFFFILSGQRFYHYDNFSHWATVVKSMLLTNRMPNESDVMVTFQAYPLGSSVFIYYVCRFLGMKEGYMLFAQLLIMLSFIFTGASLFNRRNVILVLAFILWGVSALTVYSNIYMLLVDTVMPLAGLATFAMFLSNRGNSNQKELTKLVLSAMPIAFFLIQVKNSGIYYLLIALLYFAFVLWKAADKKNRILFLACDIGLPLLSMALWKIHLNFAFSNANSTEHAMSLSRYADVSGAKTSDDIKAIVDALLAKLPYTTATYMLFLACFIYGVIILVNYNNKKPVRHIVMELVGMVSAYVFYIVSIFLMYIFSMSLDEALELASYDRYMLSAYIFLMGMTVMFAIKNRENGIKLVEGLGIVLITAVVIMTYYEKIPAVFGVNRAEYTSRNELLTAIEDSDIEPNSKCIVYYGNTDERYLNAVAKYDLWTNIVIVANSDDLYQCKDILEYCDYFIIVTPDEVVDAFVNENMSDIYACDGTNVINISDNSSK